MQPDIEKGHKVDNFPNRTSINGTMRDETSCLLRKYVIICQYKNTNMCWLNLLLLQKSIEPGNARPALQCT